LTKKFFLIFLVHSVKVSSPSKGVLRPQARSEEVEQEYAKVIERPREGDAEGAEQMTE